MCSFVSGCTYEDLPVGCASVLGLLDPTKDCKDLSVALAVTTLSKEI